MSIDTKTVQLAEQLISFPSITPNEAGCQEFISKLLTDAHFAVERLPFGNVENIWAHHGQGKPYFIFSGHTDVVPPGPAEKWQTPPFQASIRDGYLYGRGAADMKGALAAFLIASKNFVEKYPNHKGTLGLIITGDEEGEATNGTKKVVEYLLKKDIKPDWCLIGEASSAHQLGDTIKVGRRGSLHGELQVIGKQGHIAYPQLAENPIHRSFKALDSLTQTEWDQGNQYFTPTSFQIYNIHADTGASNVIPGSLIARFNFRFSPASSAEELQTKVHKIFDDFQLNYKIDWKLASEPFLSPDGELRKVCIETIREICKLDTQANTTGGTSDGRFIAPTGCEIVELGAVNECIHQINEHIKIDDLNKLTEIYEDILKRMLGPV
jgi:succinyl-diaminopimelate desuccinylase